MMSFIKIVLIIILTQIFYAQAPINKQRKSGQPFIKHFSPKVYKAGNVNWSIIQDKNGMLYVGNENCLLEYDGNNWRKIKSPNNDVVRAIDIDESGNIYLASGSDFGYLETDSLSQYHFKSLLNYVEGDKNLGEVWDVVTSTHGIYFKTRDKILRWANNKIKIWDSVYAYRLYKIDDKIYSRNQDVGLMVIEGDSIKVMPDGEYFSSTGVYNMIPFNKKSVDGKTQILITTNHKGLFLHDGNKFSPFKTEADELFKNRQIYNACSMSNGNYAFATERGGVLIIDSNGRLLNMINKNSSLPTDVVYDVFSDRNGGLWFATLNGIAFCEEPSSFSTYKDKGLMEDMIYSVIRYDEKLFVTNELGTFYLAEHENNFQMIAESKKPAYRLINVDGILIAYTNEGIAIIKNGKYSRIINVDGGVEIIRSIKDPRIIYLGSDTGFGVLKIENNNVSLTFEKYLIDGVTKIAESSDGSLWLKGYFDGIYHVTGNMSELQNGREENVDFKYYEVRKTELPFEVYDIFQVKNDVLFQTNKGLFNYDSENRTFTKESLFGNTFSDSTQTILHLRKNHKGELWILADMNGELDFGKAVINENGKYEWKPEKAFRRIDLSSVLDFYSEVSEKSREEIIWFCTDNSLIKYDLSSAQNYLTDYSTLIRKITIGGDSLIYAGKDIQLLNERNIILSSSDNDIEFEFSALQFIRNDKTLYQYYLEGNDKNWSQWTSDTKKEYTNLSKGVYKFQVRSKNVYGTISESDVFEFEVLAPWYFTYWAFAVYALLISLGIFITDRIMRKKIIDRERERNKLIEAEFRAQAAELQAKAAEAQSKYIQAENERKTEELEEARELQLSMLPRDLPNIKNLEIAVYMKTATEVGGDYYDFSLKADGSVNIAIGDATGHGMKAGLLVSMMKTLFLANSAVDDIKDYFESANKALKKANLKRMMMSFAMININGNKGELINAGMPPVYYLNAKEKKLEEINIHSLPLGGMKNDKYTKINFEFGKGDVVLMLSDGYPEIQNENGEQLGYEKIKIICKDHFGCNPKELIKSLNEYGNEWLRDNDPEDDITFIAIQIN